MLNLIPQPQKTVIETGEYQKEEIKELYLHMPLQDTRLVEAAENIFPVEIINAARKSNDIYMLTTQLEEGCEPTADEINILKEKDEGYLLIIDEKGLFLYSMTAKGLFYGIQTLAQLFMDKESVICCRILDWPQIRMRSMYYDLRQTFPSPDNLVNYIREMAAYKINTLVIEYEDKLPFHKHPELTDSESALTMSQFEEMQRIAYQNFIEMIPLQQSFGHLEYLLKHSKYRHLREIPEAVGEVCPCKEESFNVVAQLLDEMIEHHPLSRYLHIGCDEVWSLLSCPDCKKQYGQEKNKMFIEYVNKVIQHVCKKGKIPIIWHDMMAQCNDEEIRLLDNRAVVMIWLYNGIDVEQQVINLTKRFRAAGVEVMGAPAVRCHDSDDLQNIPHAVRRIDNINQWVNAAVELELPCLVSTNWGTAFSMGAPYGLFETTFYLMYYSAERYWNPKADSGSYLSRYLQIYHGMTYRGMPYRGMPYHGMPEEEAIQASVGRKAEEEAIQASVGHKAEEYYLLIPAIANQVNRKREVAEFLLAMHNFEEARWPFQAAMAYAYRYERCKDSEAEMTSLKYRVSRYTARFIEAKQPLYEAVVQFLSPGMAQMYVDARYTAYEYLNEEFFKPMLDTIQIPKG